MTHAERLAADATAAVGSWLNLTRVPGTVHKLNSGGFLVDVGDAFPVFRADMGAVRRLLLERDLAANP